VKNKFFACKVEHNKDLKALENEKLEKYKNKCEAYKDQVEELIRTKEDEHTRLTSECESMENELAQLRKQYTERDAQALEYEKLIDMQKARLRSLEAESKDMKVNDFAIGGHAVQILSHFACLSSFKFQNKDWKMQEQKLNSIEQANRILEEELSQVKRQSQADKINLNELNVKLNDENKKLNSKLNELHAKYVDLNEHFGKTKSNDNAKIEQYELIIKQFNCDLDMAKQQLGKQADRIRQTRLVRSCRHLTNIFPSISSQNARRKDDTRGQSQRVDGQTTR
jgi:hypothetical protein